MATYLYVALENTIASFALDTGTGELGHRRDVPTSGAVGPLAVDPQRQYLYAGVRSTREMASYRIDSGTGNLSHLNTIPLEADPCFISTDRTGRFLLSAYYRAGGVAVHPILSGGRLGSKATQWFPTAANAHMIETDPSNRFAFVPHIAGPNFILQFRFDAETGVVRPNAVPKVMPSNRVGPRHYCFHPNQPVVYFVNEQGCSVTAYHFDPTNGTLEPFQTITTLPQDFVGENTCAQIHIAPLGRFLYASNRGHDSIACFSIDAETGELETRGQQPTEEMPRAFNIDPDGNFLFAAGLVTGKLSTYQIDQQIGTLFPQHRVDVGARPMWVLVLRSEN
jgi:6-phosphogluconolactonase